MDYFLSGGADGADLAWGEIAGRNGFKVMHYSFGKHKRKNGEDCIILSQERLNEADPYLKTANKTLKRAFPTSSEYVNNLLRRNYYQIQGSSAIYAIINGFDKDNPNVVNGGTAWAIQMFIDRQRVMPIYVFNQLDNRWYNWQWFWDAEWNLMSEKPKRPYGVWTGIGTRQLTPEGKAAIASVFGE